MGKLCRSVRTIFPLNLLGYGFLTNKDDDGDGGCDGGDAKSALLLLLSMLGADLDFFIFGGDGVVKSIAAVPMSSPFLPAAAWAGSSFLRFGGGGDFVMDVV